MLLEQVEVEVVHQPQVWEIQNSQEGMGELVIIMVLMVVEEEAVEVLLQMEIQVVMLQFPLLGLEQQQ